MISPPSYTRSIVPASLSPCRCSYRPGDGETWEPDHLHRSCGVRRVRRAGVTSGLPPRLRSSAHGQRIRRPHGSRPPHAKAGSASLMAANATVLARAEGQRDECPASRGHCETGHAGSKMPVPPRMQVLTGRESMLTRCCSTPGPFCRHIAYARSGLAESRSWREGTHTPSPPAAVSAGRRPGSQPSAALALRPRLRRTLSIVGRRHELDLVGIPGKERFGIRGHSALVHSLRELPRAEGGTNLPIHPLGPSPPIW